MLGILVDLDRATQEAKFLQFNIYGSGHGTQKNWEGSGRKGLN